MQMLKIDEGDFGFTATLRIKLVLEEFGDQRFGELDSCRLSRSRPPVGGGFVQRHERVGALTCKIRDEAHSSLDGRGCLEEKASAGY